MLPAKQPLEKTPATSSLQERIRQSLEDELRSGAMRPGDAIDEPALCERFGASRTPVREALLLLVAKGLVEIVPRSGIYVRRLDARELVAMMEGLAELEGVLARLAATRIHAQLRERLQAALAHTAACAQAQDAEGYVQANMQLHELIYEASGNDFIVEQTRLLRLRITPYRGRMFEKPGRLARSQQEHATV
ncbi:GntR family transcriptional regulator, partial [Delftia acidovorans]